MTQGGIPVIPATPSTEEDGMGIRFSSRMGVKL